MDSIKKQRRQIFVDRQVQGGILLRLVLLWLVTTTFAIAIALLLQYFADPMAGFAHYYSQIGRHLFPLVLAFTATLPIAVLHLLRFTHRFAGPVVRLRNSLRELAAGEQPPRLKFRDRDYWQHLADEFNEVADALTQARARIAELEEQAADAEIAATERFFDAVAEPAVTA